LELVISTSAGFDRVLANRASIGKGKFNPEAISGLNNSS
jgi:hypothetical protein